VAQIRGIVRHHETVQRAKMLEALEEREAEEAMREVGQFANEAVCQGSNTSEQGDSARTFVAAKGGITKAFASLSVNGRATVIEDDEN